MRRVSVALSLGLALYVPAAHARDVVRLANIEWPPYNSRDMADGGAMSYVVAEIFARVGIRVEYEFLPFQRAVAAGTSDPSFHGYLTEYATQETRARCRLSAPLGRSTVVFVSRLGQEFDWRGLSSLAGLRLGVIAGYVNDGATVDAALRDGQLVVDRAPDDVTMLRRVAAGHVDVGIVDANLLRYVTNVHADIAGVLVPSRTVLAHHTLHVCFAKTAEGERFATLLADAHRGRNVDQLYSNYFQRTMPRSF